MLGVFNYKYVSQLHRAYQEYCSADVNSQDVVAKMPVHLQERVTLYGARHASESSNAKQMQLALRDIINEIYDSESQCVKEKIHSIFRKSYGVRRAEACQWGERHVKDDDKVERLLYSLEINSLQTEVENWAGNNADRQKSAKKIMCFIKNPSATTLDLSGMRLSSLPDVFDSIIISARLTCLNLEKNQLAVLPESIGVLAAMTELYVNNNHLVALPESIGGLTALAWLDVSENQLTALPHSIEDLTALNELDVSFNRLTVLPESIGSLAALNELSVSSNQLVALPNSILNLPNSCEVVMENSGLSNQVLGRLAEICHREGYIGPRFYFSISDHNHLDAPQNLGQSFRSLHAITKSQNFTDVQRNYPNLHHCISHSTQKTDSLQNWLSRLCFMQPNRRELSEGLSKKILSYLELAEQSDVFREQFFNTIEEAARSCGDRMALSVLHLGIQHKMASINKTDLKGFAEFLIHGPWMLEQLQQIAREKVASLRFVDEIEVYLGYPVKLRERLKLQIDVEDMLYFACSGITGADLDNAVLFIESQLESPDAIASILVQREDWTVALKKSHPLQMAAFLREKDSQFKNVKEDVAAFLKIQNKYMQNIFDLTKKALK